MSMDRSKKQLINEIELLVGSINSNHDLFMALLCMIDINMY